jgi:hypothetical protein
MQKPAVGGPFWHRTGYRHEGRTAWLGREESNLRMAESLAILHRKAGRQVG